MKTQTIRVKEGEKEGDEASMHFSVFCHVISRSSATSMSKHPASTLTVSQARKRKRNGVSASRAVLDSTGVPSASNQTMDVWNADANKLHEVQKSTIPLQSMASAARLEDLVENTLAECTTYVREPGKKRREKKRTNDSVSHLNIHFHSEV
jgi:hypothetical protein